METTIAVQDLTKTFGHTRALDGLDLWVHRGEVHGLLGPNGAGKSTTVRILLGLMRKDSGTLHLFDGNHHVSGRVEWIDPRRIHRRIAS